MVAQATVHTTGVNWESVAVIVSAITGIVGVLFGFLAKWVSGQIVSAIDRFQLAVTTKLDHRLTRVEVKVDTLRARQTRDD